MSKKIKYILFFMILSTAFLAFPSLCFGANITINGENVPFSKTAGLPFLDSSNRVQVPLRASMEAAGCEVDWDDEARTAIVKKNGITVQIPIDQSYIIRDGTVIENDSKAVIKSEITYLPIRAVFEAFGADVNWDSKSNTIRVYMEDEQDGKKEVVPENLPLTAKQIALKASPSVFFIDIYQTQSDYANHFPIETGSGFFLSPEGIAVTNYHVIQHASVAVITLTDGNQYRISDILYYDKDADYAVVRVSKTSLMGKDTEAFPYLHAKDSLDSFNGDIIYTIGSPLGLQNSISNGIISNKERLDKGLRFIQITAPISSGSSGGALLDEYGNAIGITSGSFVNGQNLNVAIPLDDILSKDLTIKGVPFGKVYEREFKDAISKETAEFMEQVVYEKNSEKIENYESINNRDTLIGSFASADSHDYYCFATPIPVNVEIIAGDGETGLSRDKNYGWNFFTKSSMSLRLDKSPGALLVKGRQVVSNGSVRSVIKEITLEPGVYYIHLSHDAKNESEWKNKNYYIYFKMTPISDTNK